MGFHHLSKERNNHQPYRWVVDTETDRLNIHTNQDGSPILSTDGLYCRCLQLDDLSEWILSSIDPIEWVSAGGQTKNKTIFFTLTTPQHTVNMPINDLNSGFFNINVASRTAPYIKNNFDNYSNFLFDCIEYDINGAVVNTYIGEQFTNYAALIDFLNLNLEIDGSDKNLYNFELSCYAYTDTTSAISDRIIGSNILFNVLRGKHKYRSTQYKTIAPSDSWSGGQDFINQIYNDFLATTPPSFANACKTIWVPQTPKRMYLKTGTKIEFTSGIVGSRMYYNQPNGVPYNVTGGTWTVGISRVYSLDLSTLSTQSNEEVPDYNMVHNNSLVRVYQLTNGTPGRYAWLVKPIGMDLFKLGWCNFAQQPDVKLYMEVQGRNTSSRVVKLTNTTQDVFMSFANTVSSSIYKSDIINSLIGSLSKHTVGKDYIFRKVRFFYANAAVIKTNPTKWIEFLYKQTSDSPHLMLSQSGS